MRSDRKFGAKLLRNRLATFGVAAAVVSAGVWFSQGAFDARSEAKDTAAAQARAEALVRRNMPKLPLSFEANRGQTDKAVNFVARGAGTTLWLTDTEAVFGFSTDGKGADDVLRMQFVGAGKPQVEGVELQTAKSNYFTGASAAITAVPHFGEVSYMSLYPGVDVRWYGDRSKLEYDVVVAPGADASVVRMKMQGADEVSVAKDGGLAVKFGDREIVQHAPVAYQMNGETREIVAAAFDVVGDEVAFKVGSYDASRTLVIDPAIDWSTYFGGAGDETGNRVAVSSVDGTVVVCGGTTSIDLPLGYGHIPNAPKGSYDAYVTKLSAGGDFVLHSTYLAGSEYDEAFGVAIDQDGSALGGHPGAIWVTGQTWSSNFPTFRPMQSAKAGAASWDAFVVGMDKDGAALYYSSYLGGSKNDYGRGIELDRSSFVYVTGFTNSEETASTPFPIRVLATQPTYGGGANDAFLTVYDPRTPTPTNYFGATGPYSSTYIGGLGDDRAYDLAVGQAGNPTFNGVYVCGFTGSPNFPHKNAFNAPLHHTVQDLYAGGLSDAFLVRFKSGGGQLGNGPDVLEWATTWGGSGDDWANGVGVDSLTGDVAIVGRTNSFDYPRVSAIQQVRKGPDDGFVAKFKATGDVAVFSTYIGGKGSDQANDVVINGAGAPPSPFSGDVYVVGTTESLDFPVTNDAVQSNLHNNLGNPMNTDAWLARFGTFHNDFGIDQDGMLKFASYFGGNDYDYGNGIALRTNSTVVIAGTTRSVKLFSYGPLPVFQEVRKGPSDAFAAKINTAGPILFPAADTLAVARTPDSIEVSWKNPILDATDLVIERIGTDGVSTTVATVAPTTTQFTDTGLAPDTTYNYQVTAQINDGTTVQSNVLAASTLPYPPAAPTGLTVATDGAKVSLEWLDAATNESGYEVQRSIGDAEFSVVATAKAGATKFETTQILTGEQDASWRVVAVNRGGSSAPSNEVSATATPTLSVSVLKGTLVDARTSGADKFSASGNLAGAAGFDPNAQSLRIELGSSQRPLVLNVPAGDRGWSAKKGVLKFDSARSFVGGARFQLVLDAKKGTFSLAVSSFDFPQAVANPVSLGFAFGDKAGAAQGVWTAKGAGKYSAK
jgi:hypothetical protein